VQLLFCLQEELVEQLESDITQELRRIMLNLENMRLKFLLKMYHKTRLKKIEKFAASIAADDEASRKLSRCVSIEGWGCHVHFTVHVLMLAPSKLPVCCQIRPVHQYYVPAITTGRSWCTAWSTSSSWAGI